MEIVFESAAVLVADKPAGMLTVPSRMGAADARPCLGRLLEAARGLRLWPVHRLDLEVSGLVLFAKSAEAHRVASLAFEGRRVRKRYEALTEGADALGALPAEYRWESLLVRGKRRSFAAPHGKPAVTVARALARVPAAGLITTTAQDGPPPAALVRFALEPETGRAHQLRVHLATAGFPIAGDRLYGARTSFGGGPHNIALRAVGLDLLDETDRAALGIEAGLAVAGLLEAAGPVAAGAPPAAG
jgi:tRNA pseudouridine32 synthase/23S rRNA pseudouridine746 synthase